MHRPELAASNASQTSISSIQEEGNDSQTDVMTPTRPFVLSPILACTALLALLSGLNGCQVGPSVDANLSALSNVKRIAVMNMHKPEYVMVQNFGLAMGFGAIGGAIQGGSNADKSKQLTAVLSSHKPTLNDTLVAAVASSLRTDGYDVVVVDNAQDALTPDKKHFDLSRIHVQADATLIVVPLMTGYISPPNTAKYQPQLMVRAQLTETRTQQDLYLKVFFVGYKAASIGNEDLPADVQFRFGSFDDLMNRAEFAAAGLESCERTAAGKVAADLRMR